MRSTLSVLLLCLVLAWTTVRAGAESGFIVEGAHPGMTLDPAEGGVRITVPFTVKGSQYLLRILGKDGTIHWIGQQEGGRYDRFRRGHLAAAGSSRVL